jgi:hypothetical protein
MKRTYIKPEVFLLDEGIETSILVISGLNNEATEKENGGIGGETPSGEGGGGPGARGGSLFEDDYDF